MTLEKIENRLAGYTFLIERYDLRVWPNWHTSSISPKGTLHSTTSDGRVKTVYPQSYWPGDGVGGHLEFALKCDGVNLGILAALFSVISADELAAWIRAKPIGKYVRRI